uniref:Uncharacterized protein n=1 Tax=Ciona savignyi TaxID=51511 RepID=H2YZJ1_CIOSA
MNMFRNPFFILVMLALVAACVAQTTDSGTTNSGTEDSATDAGTTADVPLDDDSDNSAGEAEVTTKGSDDSGATQSGAIAIHKVSIALAAFAVTTVSAYILV